MLKSKIEKKIINKFTIIFISNMMSGKTSSNPMMNSYKALLAIAIVSFITAGISVLIVLCLWSKINLAIAIIKVTKQ